MSKISEAFKDTKAFGRGDKDVAAIARYRGVEIYE